MLSCGPVSGSTSQAGTGLVSVPGYEILGELGRGGMGVVYRARQIKANRIVALKMILAGGHAGAAELARFRTEAQAIAALQHPHIVQVFDVGEHDGLPYFSLEFCAGGSLDRTLAGTPLPSLEAAQLVETLARAMHAAHQAGVIHRDLKPANVLLAGTRDEGQGTREDGSALVPKITDFGLAKKLDDASGQTQSGAIMGTPSYMAPEQAGGKSKKLGPAADLYALGAILYECLTGRPPFKAATVMDTLRQVVHDEPVPPSQLQSKMPRDLETICLKCLQKDPRKRYANAAALAEDLRHFLAGEPIAARPVSRFERGWRWCRRNPAVASLLAAVFLLVTAGTTVAVVLALLANRRADDLQESNAKLRQSRDQYEQSVARGLLRPMATQHSSRLSDEEIDALWELASSSEEGLRRRFVELSVRNPGTTRQLKDRRSFALHAAVGLDIRRRDMAEQVLAQRLSTAEVDSGQGVDLALTLTALGELSSPVAAQTAAVLTRAMSKTTNRSELGRLAQGLSAIASRREAKEAAASLAQALDEARDIAPLEVQSLGKALSALAARMAPRDAAATLAATLVQALNQAGKVESWIPEFQQGLSEAAARMGPEDAGPAAATLAQAITRENGSHKVLFLGQALSAVAARMEPRDATRVCAPAAASLAQYVLKTSAPSRVVPAAQALAAVAARMEPREAARVCGPAADSLAQALGKRPVSNDPMYLAQALAAVAARIDSRNAARLCGQAAATLALDLSPTTLPHVRSMLLEGLSAVAGQLNSRDAGQAAATLVQALSKTNDPNIQKEWLQGLSAVADQLDPKDAGQAAANLALAMTRTAHHWELQGLARGLAVVAARMAPPEAARVCGPTAALLALAMTRATDANLMVIFAEGLAAVAVRIDPTDAGQAAAALSRALRKTAHPFEQWALAKGLAAMAPRMEPRAAALALALSKRSEIVVLRWLAEALPHITPQLGPKDAATLCGPAGAALAQAMSRFVQTTKAPKAGEGPHEEIRQRLESDDYTLQVLAEGLAAVAARIPPPEAARVCSQAAALLALAMSQTSDPDTLQGWAQALSAVAAWMEPQEAARVCAPLTGIFIQVMSKTTDSLTLQSLSQGLSAVAARLEPKAAAATLTETMSKTTNSLALQALSQGLSAVLSHEAPVATRARVVSVTATVAGLSGPGTLFTALAFAQPALNPLPPLLPTQTLVGLLKDPLCVGEPRRLVLVQLARHYNRPFADQWEFVDHVHRHKLNLNLTTPPERPAMAAAGPR